MKNRFAAWIGALLLGLGAAVYCTVPAFADTHIKAAMYFGEESPSNFWSGEHVTAENDFARLRADGFNTVIFVLPWREFQPDALKEEMDGAALARLDAMLTRAEASGLGTMLRLGYTWDYNGSDNVQHRFEMALSDGRYRNGWLFYAAQIYQLASRHSSFRGAFMTWEDFWGSIDYGQASAAYYREFDTRLVELLTATQQVFPGLSMECRLDEDPCGAKTYFHELQFPCGTAAFSSVMLSASMGFGSGQILDPGTAAAKSAELLEKSARAAGKGIFVDQFLYQESTPGYEGLAHFADGGAAAYLTAMGPVLNRQSIGYGLWTYRDYVDSLIYNPEFGLGLKDWSTVGSVRLETGASGQRAMLETGAMLIQDLGIRGFVSGKPTQCELLAEAAAEGTLIVKIGGVVKRTGLQPGLQKVSIDFGKSCRGSICIAADVPVAVDNVKVFSHVTTGGIYDRNGAPGPNLGGVRSLNAQLH